MGLVNLEKLLDKAFALNLNNVESLAYNYLLEEYEGQMFIGLEGERLRELCMMILENKIMSKNQ
jgi:hypothetical protein